MVILEFGRYMVFQEEGIAVIKDGVATHLDKHLGHLPSEEAGSSDVVHEASTGENHGCSVCRG